MRRECLHVDEVICAKGDSDGRGRDPEWLAKTYKVRGVYPFPDDAEGYDQNFGREM